MPDSSSASKSKTSRIAVVDRLQESITESRRHAQPEKREHLRFDKAFPVRVESILFGEISCVARNVSAGGIFLESHDPLPLGAHVRVCFLTPDETGEVVALGEVKNHYFINFAHQGETLSVCGMAIRFTGFEEDGELHLRACLNRFRVLH